MDPCTPAASQNFSPPTIPVAAPSNRDLAIDIPLTGKHLVVTLPPTPTAGEVIAAVTKAVRNSDFDLVIHGAGGARHSLASDANAALAALTTSPAGTGCRATLMPALAAGRMRKRPAGPIGGQLKRLDVSDMGAVLAELPEGAQVMLQVIRQHDPSGPRVVESIPVTPDGMAAMLEAAGPGAPLAAIGAALGLGPGPGTAAGGAAPSDPGTDTAVDASSGWTAQQRQYAAQLDVSKRKATRHAENVRTNRTMEALNMKKAAKAAKRDRRRRAKLGTSSSLEPGVAVVPQPMALKTGVFGFQKGFLL